MISKEQEHIWRNIDPEFWSDIDTVLSEREAPFRVERATGQKLTTWDNPLDAKGAGQFVFDVGTNPNKTRIKLNFAWGNTGVGSTYALNRWVEELQYLLRNEEGVKVYKATAYLPNTQDFQHWCQFIEVRKYSQPQQAYCVWNGETIIQSVSKPVIRDSARDWTFDWRNAKSLEELLAAVKDL
jgi:hypothetical protein